MGPLRPGTSSKAGGKAATQSMREEAAALLERVSRFHLGGDAVSLPGQGHDSGPIVTVRQRVAVGRRPAVLVG